MYYLCLKQSIRMLLRYFICLCSALVYVETQSYYAVENHIPIQLEATSSAILAEGEKKISEYVSDILKHFQSPDPVGFPGADISDSMLVPETQQLLGLTSLQFRNITVHGLSKFRILHMNIEIESMKVTANMSIDYLEVKGICVSSTFWSEVSSPFSVKIDGIATTALASLGLTSERRLTSQDIELKISFTTISMKIENAGALGFLISSLVNTAGNFVFESIKPHVLQEVYTKAREKINRKIEEIAGDMRFPNTISPLDMLIIHARKKMRAMNMDPYKLDDYNSTMGLFAIRLSNIWIKGVSSFKRVGNISVTLENNTVMADFEIGTQQLEGVLQWEVSAISGILFKYGTAGFSVKYINGRLMLAQPVDTRKRPQLRGLDLDVGNIQVRCDGAGTIDYIIEFLFNMLPNLLAYQIELLEILLKWKIQQELNDFNVEEAILQELPRMDEIQKKGFKLSELQNIKEETTDDEFFNF